MLAAVGLILSCLSDSFVRDDCWWLYSRMSWFCPETSWIHLGHCRLSWHLLWSRNPKLKLVTKGGHTWSWMMGWGPMYISASIGWKCSLNTLCLERARSHACSTHYFHGSNSHAWQKITRYTVQLLQYYKLTYCILHARCSQQIAILRYRCGYY